MLKQLRLSGMTETLAARSREAIEHQISHPEFLALLIQDEVARREQKKYAAEPNYSVIYKPRAPPTPLEKMKRLPAVGAL